MKVVDLKSELEKLETAGKIKDQNVEVITAGQKYFIEEVDITTELVTLKVTRRNFIASTPRSLLATLKNASNGADLTIVNADKNQNTSLASIFYSDNAIELTTDV